MDAIPQWFILYEIESPAFSLRSLRSIIADFITRADELEIQRVAESQGFVQIPFPWRWAKFGQSVPEIEWFDGRTGRPRFSLSMANRELSSHVDKWNACNGIWIQFWRASNIWRASIDCLSLTMSRRLSEVGAKPWSGEKTVSIIGSARAKQEIRSFSKRTHIWQPGHFLLVTPSEVTDDITNIAMNWSQTWWLGSNLFDGLLLGSWNAHVRSSVALTCFGQNPAGAMTTSLNDKCKEMGKMSPPDPKGR